MILNRRWEIFGLVIILAVAAFFRLYHLNDTLHWRGDEGRDASIMRQMIITRHPLLIGPPTSVSTNIGPLYLGPLTYYLMTPGLWLSDGDPIGPAVVVIIFSLATVWLLWVVGRSFFHPLAGLLAAAIYAISPNAILFGRHAWNPNFMPFFALLTMWGIWQAWAKQKHWYWVVAVGSFSAAVQCHALGWSPLPVIIICWILCLRSIKKEQKLQFWRATLFSLIVGLIVISPLIIYDISHNFYSWHVLISYIFHQNNNVGGLLVVVQRFISQLRLGFEDIIVGTHFWRAWAAIILLIGTIIVTRRRIIKEERQGLFLISGFVVCNLLALALFSGPIFIQYREVLWPVIILSVGWLGWKLCSSFVKYRTFWLTASAIFLLFVGFKIIKNPTTELPNYDYQSTITAAEIIQKNNDNKPFYLGMISDRGNYDAAYRYMLERKNIIPVSAASTNQAYTICEKSDCKNLTINQLQPAGWAGGKIEDYWQLSETVGVFKVGR